MPPEPRCVVRKPQALPHPGHGAAQKLHVPPGIVAADAIVLDAKPADDDIQPMPGPSLVSKDRFRQPDGIDGGHLPLRVQAPMAGGGKKLRVKPKAVMGDEG